jgi:hypothetical protein
VPADTVVVTRNTSRKTEHILLAEVQQALIQALTFAVIAVQALAGCFAWHGAPVYLTDAESSAALPHRHHHHHRHHPSDRYHGHPSRDPHQPVEQEPAPPTHFHVTVSSTARVPTQRDSLSHTVFAAHLVARAGLVALSAARRTPSLVLSEYRFRGYSPPTYIQNAHLLI